MLLFALGCAAPHDRPPPDPGWSPAADLLAPLQEHAVVVLGDEVVVIGGYEVGMVDRVEAYDPAGDSWRALPSLPARVHHVNAAVVDDTVYVVGVLEEGFVEAGAIWALEGDRWTDLGELPADRAVGAAGVGVLDGRIHLVGGLQGGRSVDLHTAYDPATGQIEALAPAPTARDHMAAGVTGGRLAVVGGRDGGIAGVIDTLELYDPATDSWSDGAPIPTARGGVAAAVGPDGRLHVLGGEGNPDDADGVFPDHEAWDPVTDTWEELGAMLTPRHGMGAAFVGDTLWAPGGATVQGFGAVATHEGWIP